VAIYVVSVGILIILGLTVMDISSHAGGLARLDAGSNFMYDSNDIGVLFMVGLALSLWLATGCRGALRWLGIAVAAAVPMMVALSGSRGSLVGLVAVAVALLLLVRDVSWGRKVAGIAAASAVLFAAAPAGYWTQMNTIINPANDYNMTDDAGRVAIMKRGIGYMSTYPLFGVGIGNFGRAEMTLSPVNRYWQPGDHFMILAPHNTLLQVGAELGPFGLVIWLMLLGGPVVAGLRWRKQLSQKWRQETDDNRFLYAGAVYLPIAFIGFAVPSLFVSHAYLPTFYIITAFYASLVMLLGSAAGSPPGRRIRR
jgi:O-antigen ligase